MTSTPSSQENPAQVLTEALQLLRDFLEAPQRFAITNDSLRDMIWNFGGRLEHALQEGKGLDLVRHWRKRMPKVREQLLRAGEKHPAALRAGRQLPLLTEDEAKRLDELCPPQPEFP